MLVDFFFVTYIQAHKVLNFQFLRNYKRGFLCNFDFTSVPAYSRVNELIFEFSVPEVIRKALMF